MKLFAEIWHGTVDDILNAYTHHSVLSEEELERKSKFIFEKDRRAFQAAHLLKRNMLSDFARVAPKEWLFKKGTYGRPEIKNNSEKPLFFNISHKRPAVCCIVSNIPECGVDLEDNKRNVNWEEISEKVFTPSEIEYCNSEDQKFRNLWCLKEAYMKAKGMGFNLNPLSFSFRFYRNDISLKNETSWNFQTEIIKNKYTIASAVYSGRNKIISAFKAID